MKFVTVDKSNPNVSAYLLGTFSNEERALPIDFFTPNQLRSTITFRLASAKECRSHVNIRQIVSRLSRWPALSTTVGAILLALFLVPELWDAAIKNPLLVGLILATLGVMHISANVLNDFMDHMHGVDRLQFKTGSRVIQNGWLRAKTVRDIGIALFGVALIGGVLILYLSSINNIIFGILASIAVFGYSVFRRGFKGLGLGELGIFVFCGPALLLSFEYVLTGALSWICFVIGCWNGAVAAEQIFLRTWQNLSTHDRIGLRTLAVRMGADQCGALTNVLACLRWFLAGTIAAALPGVATITLVAAETWLLARTLTHSQHIRSPLSSELTVLRDVVTQFSKWSLVLVALLAFIGKLSTSPKTLLNSESRTEFSQGL